MDVLTNKSTKPYSYISRYSKFYYTYNTLDGKYIYNITSKLNRDVDYTIHNISDYDTLDLLSLNYYGRPDLYWILADFNNIRDPFIHLKDKYDTLKIPSLGKIYFED